MKTSVIFKADFGLLSLGSGMNIMNLPEAEKFLSAQPDTEFEINNGEIKVVYIGRSRIDRRMMFKITSYTMDNYQRIFQDVQYSGAHLRLTFTTHLHSYFEQCCSLCVRFRGFVFTYDNENCYNTTEIKKFSLIDEMLKIYMKFDL